MIEWVRMHPAFVGWLSLFSLATFFGTLIIIPMIVVRIPEDYFLYDAAHLKSYHRHHPLVRFFTLILKNVLGVVFILSGIAMLFLPGQGVLTILIGITFVDFPGKRALELRFISRDSVHKTINWLRAKALRPPLRLPEP